MGLEDEEVPTLKRMRQGVTRSKRLKETMAEDDLFQPRKPPMQATLTPSQLGSSDFLIGKCGQTARFNSTIPSTIF